MTRFLCINCNTAFESDSNLELTSFRSNVKKFQSNMFDYWRCQNCRSLHAKDEVDLGYYYRNYPGKDIALTYPYVKSFKNRLNQLSHYGLNKQSSLLDYGCGNGAFVKFLMKRGFTNVHGFDRFVPSYNNAEDLKKKYSYITCQDVIEHVDSPVETMKLLSQLLGKNGILIIGTPDAGTVDVNKSEFYMREIHAPYHRHILSQQALVSIGETFGFTPILSSNRIFSDTFWPGVNSLFIKQYMIKSGNFVDAFVEPPKWAMVLTNFKLIFYAFFGRFLKSSGNMTVIFRKL